MKLRTGFMALFVCSCIAWSVAQDIKSVQPIPPFVDFTGILTDVNGKPLSGTVGVTFYLYKDSQGGAPLWMETQNVRPGTGGQYSVMLGSTTGHGLPAEVFTSGEARWLGVEIQGQPERPRIMLLSVPYAMKAGDAQTIGGLPPSAFMLAAPSTSSSPQPGSTPPSTQSTPLGPLTPCPSITSDGTAMANQVSKFTNPCNIEPSAITETGGKVGIGTSAPGATLDVQNASTTGSTTTISGKSASSSGTAGSFSDTAATGATTGISSQVASTGGIAGVFSNTAGGPILLGKSKGTSLFEVDGKGSVTAVGATFKTSPTSSVSIANGSGTFTGGITIGPSTNSISLSNGTGTFAGGITATSGTFNSPGTITAAGPISAESVTAQGSVSASSMTATGSISAGSETIKGGLTVDGGINSGPGSFVAPFTVLPTNGLNPLFSVEDLGIDASVGTGGFSISPTGGQSSVLTVDNSGNVDSQGTGTFTGSLTVFPSGGNSPSNHARNYGTTRIGVKAAYERHIPLQSSVFSVDGTGLTVTPSAGLSTAVGNCDTAPASNATITLGTNNSCNGFALATSSATNTTQTLLNAPPDGKIIVNLGGFGGNTVAEFTSNTFLAFQNFSVDTAGTVSAGEVISGVGFMGQCLSSGSFMDSPLNGCNQDVAESYASLDATEPGDIVSLVPSGEATVRKSVKRYDPMLLGVVSANPGLLFDNGKTRLAGDNSGNLSNNKTVVALAGRVPVKVSMESGHIRVGDPLTASSHPGTAMKAISAGKIIGYALAAASRDGKVLMFVNPGYYASPDVSKMQAKINRLQEQNLVLQKANLLLTSEFRRLSNEMNEIRNAVRDANLSAQINKASAGN